MNINDKADEWDAFREARIVCEVIGVGNGVGTVASALAEAYQAGCHDQINEELEEQRDYWRRRADRLQLQGTVKGEGNIAWLIERYSGPDLAYWSGRKGEDFIADVNWAVRFARFEDAEQVRGHVVSSGEFCRSVEHAWFCAQPSAVEPPATLPPCVNGTCLYSCADDECKKAVEKGIPWPSAESNVVIVPDVPGPRGVCWQSAPTMDQGRCTFRSGHEGSHQWEQTSPSAETPTPNSWNPQETLFAFLGWLTSRRERSVFSSTDDAAPAVDLIQQFAQRHQLVGVRDRWDHLIVSPRDERQTPDGEDTPVRSLADLAGASVVQAAPPHGVQAMEHGSGAGGEAEVARHAGSPLTPSALSYSSTMVSNSQSVADVLARYPANVGTFMRAQFRLHLYPLSFTETFAAALDALIAGSEPVTATTSALEALLQAWDTPMGEIEKIAYVVSLRAALRTLMADHQRQQQEIARLTATLDGIGAGAAAVFTGDDKTQVAELLRAWNEENDKRVDAEAALAATQEKLERCQMQEMSDLNPAWQRGFATAAAMNEATQEAAFKAGIGCYYDDPPEGEHLSKGWQFDGHDYNEANMASALAAYRASLKGGQ